MFRRLFLSSLLAASLLTPGCYTVTMQVDSPHPVLLNQSQARQGYFKREDRVWYFLWGLVNSNPNVVNDLMRSQKSSAIRTFNVSTEADMLSVVLGTVTLGLVSSRVVTVEGHTK